MDTSEYTLRLKAILDTSDVQNKLSQLRLQQQSSNSTGGGFGGQLQQALLKLNTTLVDLQHSIDDLSERGRAYGTGGGGMFPVPFGRALAYRPTKGPALPNPPLKLFNMKDPKQEGAWYIWKNEQDLKGRIERPVKLKLPPGATKVGWKFPHGATKATWKLPSGAAKVTRELPWQSSAGWGLPPGAHSAFLSKMTGSRRMPNINWWKGGTTIAAPMSNQMKANLKMGAGLAFGTIAGGVENYAQASGNQGLATGASFVKNIGLGASTGAFIGGLPGALIGAGVGTLNAAFEELARRAREAASALEDQHKRIFSGQRVDNALADMFIGQRDRKALEKNDRAYFEAELKKEQIHYGRISEAMKKDVGLGGEGLERFNLREYEKETERLMKLSGKDDSEVINRQNIAKLYIANAENLQKSDARISQLEQTLKSFGSSIRSPINKRRADAAAEQANSLKDILSGMKAPDMENVNSLASQGFMISQSDDSMRLKQQTDYLRDIYTVTKQIRDKETEAATYA